MGRCESKRANETIGDSEQSDNRNDGCCWLSRGGLGPEVHTLVAMR